MTLLIDAPVGPYSPAGELRAWSEELQELRTQTTEAADVAEIDRAIVQVEGWLARAEKS